MNRNAIALTSLLCGTILGALVVLKGGNIAETVALVGVFTTIAGSAAELR